MANEWLAPTVVSSVIAGAVALATHFSAIRAKKTDSRADIRSEAFDQAKTYYTDVIERQDREIDDLREQVNNAVRKVTEALGEVEHARESVRRLAQKLEDREEELQARDRLIARVSGKDRLPTWGKKETEEE